MLLALLARTFGHIVRDIDSALLATTFGHIVRDIDSSLLALTFGLSGFNYDALSTEQMLARTDIKSDYDA